MNIPAFMAQGLKDHKQHGVTPDKLPTSGPLARRWRRAVDRRAAKADRGRKAGIEQMRRGTRPDARQVFAFAHSLRAGDQG